MPYEGPVNIGQGGPVRTYSLVMRHNQDRPTTRPVCGSRPTSQNPAKQRRKVSIETRGRAGSRDAPGLVPRPGMVCISPRRGYRKPAPAESLTERIGTTNPETKKEKELKKNEGQASLRQDRPVGAFFSLGSCENEYCVLAMQTT
jgi:hypothetical protein